MAFYCYMKALIMHTAVIIERNIEDNNGANKLFLDKNTDNLIYAGIVCKIHMRWFG